MKLHIPSPCTRATWNAMAGDERKRFCPHCDTPVYAIDVLLDSALVQIRNGSSPMLCGYRAGESEPPARTRRSVLAGAILTAVSPLFAQIGRVRIRVTDELAASIPGAMVLRLKPDDTEIEEKRSDGEGVTIWTSLPIGENRFKVQTPGFRTKTLVIVLSSDEEQVVDARIEVGTVGGLVPVSPTEAPVLPVERGSIPSKLPAK